MRLMRFNFHAKLAWGIDLGNCGSNVKPTGSKRRLNSWPSVDETPPKIPIAPNPRSGRKSTKHFGMLYFAHNAVKPESMAGEGAPVYNSDRSRKKRRVRKRGKREELERVRVYFY